VSSDADKSLWIFSPLADVLAFVAPAVLALGLVLLGPRLGLGDPSPDWLWIAAVIGVDVAHVWSTAFITYLDPRELRRRSQRYWLVPALGWVLGVLLYSLGGAAWFWRVLAYIAVFHFVRQQYGWMALYRARAGDRSRAGYWIDAAAIYACTLYPLVWWHAHLPRQFDWFLPGDFQRGLPSGVVSGAAGAYVLAIAAYAARAVQQKLGGARTPWGKHALVATTAATWYAGIVATNSDLAFMLTNVLAHGIPYAVLVFSYARHSLAGVQARSQGLAVRVLGGPALGAACRFALCLWLLAFGEELLWDRGIWHDRPELFGAGFELTTLEVLLVPLLALPQLSHYVLDGLFWRRADNPKLREWLRASAVSRRSTVGQSS